MYQLGKGKVAQGKVCAWKSSNGVKMCWKWRSPSDGGSLRYSEYGLVGATEWLTEVRSITILVLVEAGVFFERSQLYMGNSGIQLPGGRKEANHGGSVGHS